MNVNTEQEVDTDETTTDDSSSDLKRENDGIAINDHHHDNYNDYVQNDVEGEEAKVIFFSNDQEILWLQ